MSKPLPVESRVNPGYRWTILTVSVVAQATFLGAVFQGLPVLGPALRSAYGLSLSQLGLVLSCVAVGILATLLAWGAAADRFGERRVMVVGLLGAAAALLVAAQTSDAFGLAAALLVSTIPRATTAPLFSRSHTTLLIGPSPNPQNSRVLAARSSTSSQESSRGSRGTSKRGKARARR